MATGRVAAATAGGVEVTERVGAVKVVVDNEYEECENGECVDGGGVYSLAARSHGRELSHAVCHL